MPKRYDFEVTAMNIEVATMDAEVTTMDTEVTAVNTEGPWNTVTYPKRPHAVPASATKPKPPAGGGRRNPQNVKSSSGSSRKGRSHPPGRNTSHSGRNRPTHGAAARPAPASTHPSTQRSVLTTIAVHSARAPAWPKPVGRQVTTVRSVAVPVDDANLPSQRLPLVLGTPPLVSQCVAPTPSPVEATHISTSQPLPPIISQPETSALPGPIQTSSASRVSPSLLSPPTPPSGRPTTPDSLRGFLTPRSRSSSVTPPFPVLDRNNRVIINERPDGENRITVSVRYLRYGTLFSPEWGPDAQLSHACFIVFSFEFTSANAQRFTSATVTLDFTSNSQSPKSSSLDQCPIAEALAPEEEIHDLESEKWVRKYMSGKVNLGAGFAGLSADIAQVSAGKSENFTQRSTRTARGAGRATSQVEFFYRENKARKSGIAYKYTAAVILSRLDGPPTITASITAHKGMLSRSLQCAKSVDVGSLETSGELQEELRDDPCILRLARRMRW